MKRSLRTIVVAVLIGLGVFALGQSPARADHRRPVPPPVVPVQLPPVRRPIVVPPVNNYVNSNPYILPGMTFNQFATFSALSTDPMLMAQIMAYNNSMRPIVVTPTVPVYPYYPYSVPTTPYLGTTGLRYNGTPYYNPYFAAFGLYP